MVISDENDKGKSEILYLNKWKICFTSIKQDTNVNVPLYMSF